MINLGRFPHIAARYLMVLDQKFIGVEVHLLIRTRCQIVALICTSEIRSHVRALDIRGRMIIKILYSSIIIDIILLLAATLLQRLTRTDNLASLIRYISILVFSCHLLQVSDGELLFWSTRFENFDLRLSIQILFSGAAIGGCVFMSGHAQSELVMRLG